MDIYLLLVLEFFQTSNIRTEWLRSGSGLPFHISCQHELHLNLPGPRFGEPYRKRTSVWVAGSFLRGLNQTCQGGHQHVQLSGWKNRKNLTLKNRSTKGTSEYPRRLCVKWAELLKWHFG